jgi:hypothetical protein
MGKREKDKSVHMMFVLRGPSDSGADYVTFLPSLSFSTGMNVYECIKRIVSAIIVRGERIQEEYPVDLESELIIKYRILPTREQATIYRADYVEDMPIPNLEDYDKYMRDCTKADVQLPELATKKLGRRSRAKTTDDLLANLAQFVQDPGMEMPEMPEGMQPHLTEEEAEEAERKRIKLAHALKQAQGTGGRSLPWAAGHEGGHSP